MTPVTLNFCIEKHKTQRHWISLFLFSMTNEQDLTAEKNLLSQASLSIKPCGKRCVCMQCPIKNRCNTLLGIKRLHEISEKKKRTYMYQERLEWGMLSCDCKVCKLVSSHFVNIKEHNKRGPSETFVPEFLYLLKLMVDILSPCLL